MALKIINEYQKFNIEIISILNLLFIKKVNKRNNI